MITETLFEGRPRDWEYIFKKLKEQGVDIAELQRLVLEMETNGVTKADFVTLLDPAANKGITEKEAATIRALAEAAQSAADAAQDSADAAQGTADTAQSVAESAQSAANAAKSIAEAAEDTAETAQETAEAAQGTANAAQDAADTAKTTADAAAVTANTAQLAAVAAQGVATTAKNAAEAAQEDAETAQDVAEAATATANAASGVAGLAYNTAEAAQGAANEAKSAAQAAQEAANTAQGIANNAQITAAAAQGAANTAQGTANAAQSAAVAAQEAANAAQGTANKAQIAAEAATETAEAAKSIAEAAEDTAEAAKSVAEAAQETAGAALEAVAMAQDTADTALGNAASAAQDAANAQQQAYEATGMAEAAQDTADAALPKADVVAPDGSATPGQAADAAALNTIIAGLVKLASASTQEIFSNLALKTYVDSGSGQTKAFQLLGTAIDGTEHTLIELAEYGAAQQIEIGSETIHLNLNNLGPVGGDNHITCDTHDDTGAAVKLSVAWLADVVSQCAATLAAASGYTDDRIEQLRVDALILQDPCKESELPAGPFADPSHNGYFYQITDFDVTYPGGGRKGSAVWYDNLDTYYLAVDTYKNADEDTITENGNGEFMVADVETGTVIADTGGFANNATLGFKAFIAAVVAKINGLFSLISGLNTAIGLKYTKPAGGIPTSDLALSTEQGDALNSGITAALVADIGEPDLDADDETEAQAMSIANPGSTVWYPEEA